MLVHQRVEYGISDMLGDIGGILQLLVGVSALLLGGYLSFHSTIEIVKALYVSPTSRSKDNNSENFEGGEATHNGR